MSIECKKIFYVCYAFSVDLRKAASWHFLSFSFSSLLLRKWWLLKIEKVARRCRNIKVIKTWRRSLEKKEDFYCFSFARVTRVDLNERQFCTHRLQDALGVFFLQDTKNYSYKVKSLCFACSDSSFINKRFIEISYSVQKQDFLVHLKD